MASAKQPSMCCRGLAWLITLSCVHVWLIMTLCENYTTPHHHEQAFFCERMCVSAFVRGCAHVCVCVCILCCSGRRVVHYAVCVCVSPPAKPLLSQHRAPAAPMLALLPYLIPVGAPIAYSAPQGQYTGAPNRNTDHHTPSQTAQLMNSC